MIVLNFDGWFQCRLATDPDPSDEPRGVTGYMKALPGEPDLDRIIRLQPPFYQRSYTPQVGVRVRSVLIDGNVGEESGMVNAELDLLENPIFKGENGVVAEDGMEPIVPFVVEVRKDSASIIRMCPPTPEYTDFPFSGLQAFEISREPETITNATGIADIDEVITQRRVDLERELLEERDVTIRENLRRRIAFLQTRSATAFFPFLMRYRVPLAGTAVVNDPRRELSGGIDLNVDWLIEFWMGAWDADAASGFMQGRIEIPS